MSVDEERIVQDWPSVCPKCGAAIRGGGKCNIVYACGASVYVTDRGEGDYLLHLKNCHGTVPCTNTASGVTEERLKRIEKWMHRVENTVTKLRKRRAKRLSEQA